MGMLDGKIALVTGNAGGQGKVACKGFARGGTIVIGCDLRSAENAETVRSVREADGEITGFVPVDLTDHVQVGRFGSIAEMPIEDWRATIAGELDSTNFVTRCAWPDLVTRSGGVVINVASMAGMIGFPQSPMAAYAAANAGLIGLTRQFAVEGAPVGIRAVNISPGAIVTREADLEPAQREAIGARTLLERWGKPEEVVEVAAFLASDRTSHITGANIPIEGDRLPGNLKEQPMTDLPKIAVIISTTRAARFADIPATWIVDLARARGDMDIELIDLRHFPMPFFDEAASNLYVPSQNEVAQRWQRKVAEFDGYIFVTAEYNRGISGVLKNALDYAYPEWNRKPAACLGYGSVGGARAIEQLRLNLVELQMAPTRNGVHIQGVDFFEALQNGKPLADIPFIEQNAVTMLDELYWWTMALKAARASAH